MDDSIITVKLQDIVQSLGQNYQLMTWSRLTGGVSAKVFRLDVQTPDQARRQFVLKCYGERDVAANPDVAKKDFMLMRRLKKLNIPAPKAYLIRGSNSIFDTPYLVMDYIEGEPYDTQSPIVVAQQMATYIAHLHNETVQDYLFSFHSRFNPRPEYREHSDNSISAIYRLLYKSLEKQRLTVPRILLHNDFWPGNTLWKDQTLVGVIDWEDSILGHPMIDVANTRLELLWAFGWKHANAFLTTYESLSNVSFGIAKLK